jgi:hypothetical protein
MQDRRRQSSQDCRTCQYKSGNPDRAPKLDLDEKANEEARFMGAALAADLGILRRWPATPRRPAPGILCHRISLL